jgi:hypothetical protein
MPDNGNYTMIGGLSFQAFTLLVFLGLSGDFAKRTVKAYKRRGNSTRSEDPAAKRLRQSKRFWLLIFSLTLSAVLIFMRSVYRVAELSEGWKGRLMTTEKFVLWLEAIPVAISGLFLSIFHPANCFPEHKHVEEELELPETPPSVSSGTHRTDQTEESDKYRSGSRYGSVVVTLDPTFDRKHWR